METPNNNNDDHYHWRLFYYNTDDTRIFVPKRYGFGWTSNFANIWSYVLLAALIGITVFIRIWSSK